MTTTKFPANAAGLPTRRTAMASLAGLGAAMSLPAAAKAAASLAPDPVFATIEKHRRAWSTFSTAVGEWSDKLGQPPAEVEARIDAASDAETEARYDMHQTVPETIAGLIAYVAYYDDFTSRVVKDESYMAEAFPTIAEAFRALLPAKGAAIDSLD